jgi:Flp pilus assembly secretin CpaC/tetratricopeptide (TPR) repeat protein
MNEASPLSRPGRWLLVLALLAACSTQGGREEATTPPSGQTPPASQGQPQDRPLQEQRRETVIEQSLQEAERALSLKLWSDAARTAAQVLDMDPNNERARQILFTAQDLLGQTQPSAERQFQDRVLEDRVAFERDQFRARRELAAGDAHVELGRYGDAIESYRRGLLILQYSPYARAGSDLQTSLETKLSAAEQAKARADQDADEARRAASRAQLQEEERRLQIQRMERVRRLMDQANLEFQVNNFDSAVGLLDKALQEDPANPGAQNLRELASRARHDQAMDVLRQRWKSEWSKTFDELRASDVPQTDTIKYDMQRWAEVAMRKPLQLTSQEALDSPEERAIRAKLEGTVIEHKFPSATVQDWARYYQNVTEVTFVVTKEVAEMDSAATTLNDFNLPAMSVERALAVIGNLTGVRYRIEAGMVQLVPADKAKGRKYVMLYQVQDLIQGVPDRPGRELKLTVPGDDPDTGVGDEEEPKPTVVDAGKLEELIKNNIEPTSWEEGSSIATQRGVLVVRNSREVHTKIERLLADLRQAVGIQVNVEARFLRVEDSFLEDVGLDFRGLGDQSSGGIAGRGLEQNNRGNLRFDDYGQPQQTSPAAPGEIGTGTEPGIFFDDGQDGDYMARTENLFDSTLGGGDGQLDNAGGLSLQYAFLDDTQVEVVLRAVQKQERNEIITAPRLVIYNNARANMSVLRHTSYIRDFEVEIAQSAAVANPVVDVVRDGVVMDVRPVVSADRRFITMELRPTVMDLQVPIPTFTTTLGVGQPISIQLPRVTLQRVRTTVTMPDGATIMLGGMNLAEKSNLTSGVPILKDIPGISFFFSRRGTFTENRKILILVRAEVVVPGEHEPLYIPDELTAVQGGR